MSISVSVTTVAQVVIDRNSPNRMTWLQVKAGGRRGFVAQLLYTHTPNGCKPDWYVLEEQLDTGLTQQALKEIECYFDDSVDFPLTVTIRSRIVLVRFENGYPHNVERV